MAGVFSPSFSLVVGGAVLAAETENREVVLGPTPGLATPDRDCEIDDVELRLGLRKEEGE